MRYLLAIAIVSVFSGCTCGPNPNPDPCKNVTCGQYGTCDNGTCVCQQDFYGDKCDMHFSPADFSASKAFCATDSGKLEIAGATGSESYLNGYYIDVPAGATDRCVWFLLSPATGANLPAPDSDRLVPTAHGLEVTAVDKENPLLADGSLNKVPLLKEIKVFFNHHRGRVQLFESDKFTTLYTEFQETGCLGKTQHLSPFYLLDGKPVVAATLQRQGSEVTFDFSDTMDEGSPLPYLLQFTASGDGTLLMLTAVDNSGGLKFRATLPASLNKLTAMVTDPYGNTSSKVFSSCGDSFCEPFQACRTLDNTCVGSDPCSPNPCAHGSCSSASGSAVCTCTGGWLGDLCDIQDKCFGVSCSSHGTCQTTDGSCLCNTGYAGSACDTCDAGFIGYPDCVDNPCLPNPCQNSGTCSLSGTSAVCTCTNHWNPQTSCTNCLPGWEGATCNTQNLCYGVNCPDDGQYCNGVEICDPGTGQCVHQNPPTCSGHGNCNEGTDICDCNPYFTGSTCSVCASGTIGTYPDCQDDPCDPNPCQHGGSCSVVVTSAECTCTNHWDPTALCATCIAHWDSATNCTTCVGGWMGVDCNTVDLCYGVSCNGHGACSAGTCSCDTGFDPTTNCGSCAAGYYDYPTCHVNHAPVISNLQASPNPVGQYTPTTITFSLADSDGDTISWTITLTAEAGYDGWLSTSNGTCDRWDHCYGTVNGSGGVTVTFNTGYSIHTIVNVSANDGRGGTDSEGPYGIDVQ